MRRFLTFEVNEAQGERLDDALERNVPEGWTIVRWDNPAYKAWQHRITIQRKD